VIVSSSIQKNGSVINGDIKQIVVVRTNPGYDPAPGHVGTGTVVAILCGPTNQSASLLYRLINSPQLEELPPGLQAPEEEDCFLNPPPGSAAARAVEFGIDLTLTLENLRLTPEERIRKLDRRLARGEPTEHYRHPKDLLMLLELEAIQEWQLKVRDQKQ